MTDALTALPFTLDGLTTVEPVVDQLDPHDHYFGRYFDWEYFDAPNLAGWLPEEVVTATEPSEDALTVLAFEPDELLVAA
jgi:hypothetical protein